MSLSTDHNTSLYADRMVPPEPAVQTWTNVQGEKVALSVQSVAQQAPYERQFWLCLQQEVLKTRRTTCSRWEVPAEWRLDLPLTFRGIRVTDDLTSSGQPGQVRLLDDGYQPAADTVGEVPADAATQGASTQGHPEGFCRRAAVKPDARKTEGPCEVMTP